MWNWFFDFSIRFTNTSQRDLQWQQLLSKHLHTTLLKFWTCVSTEIVNNVNVQWFEADDGFSQLDEVLSPPSDEKEQTNKAGVNNIMVFKADAQISLNLKDQAGFFNLF